MAVVEDRYAGALLEISISENSVEDYLGEVEALRLALTQNEELLALYQNPKITLEEKLDVTEKCFAQSFSADIVGLIELVVRNGRSAALIGILESYISNAKDYLKIGIVYVEAAAPLSEAQQKRLEEKLLDTTSYTTLEMHYSIRKELIGGMVIRIKDRILDNSIKTKLDGMARELRQVQL